MTLETVAVDLIRPHIERGWALDVFLKSHTLSVNPPTAVMPASVWVYVGGWLFKDKAGDERIKLKSHQIGVAFYWRDGRNEHAIFDARRLWEEIVNPKPVQLELELVFA